MHIAIVFNPNAGQRAAASRLSDVVAALASHNHNLIVIDCQRQPDFERELRLRSVELDRVIVIGGDGTLSSAVNAIVTSENPELPVAFVPTGRGKDTARSLPSWNDTTMAGGAFESAEVVPIDLIKVSLQSGTRRYAVNISSVGIGAHAAAVANKLPRVLGSLSYVLGAMKGFVPLRAFSLSMRIDNADHVIDNALLVAACNGKSFGGGIYLAPESDHSDGLIDLVVAQNANLGDLALQLGKLKSGIPFEHPALTRWQAQSIEINPIDNIRSEADGEALSSQPLRFTIAPKALNWVTP